VVEDTTRLLADVAGDDLPALRVERDLPGAEDKLALDDGLAVRSDRTRRLVGRDRAKLLSHATHPFFARASARTTLSASSRSSSGSTARRSSATRPAVMRAMTGGSDTRSRAAVSPAPPHALRETARHGRLSPGR